ncbi:MAG: phenylacetic acid degradation bifunctional protein PaaZ [Burkholderiaceae bacterium]
MAVKLVQSYLAGQWTGHAGDRDITSAITGEVIAQTCALEADLVAALDFARERAQSEIVGLGFAERAGRLKALGKFLSAHKAELEALSRDTGATHSDHAFDIDGGIGTVFAFASMGAAELPAGQVWHEGPVIPLGRKGGFAGTHILVAKPGVAVHINAFNFPVWGMLEKFAPAYLAGMPCLFKPATNTSYVTEHCVRLIERSGLIAPSALQLLVGPPDDLLDALQTDDVLTFTGSAETANKLRAHPAVTERGVALNVEADSLNALLVGPDVQDASPEFDIAVAEVVREMTVKAGQKCTAIRRVVVPEGLLESMQSALASQLQKTVAGDPDHEDVSLGALVSASQRASVTEQVNSLLTECECVIGGPEPVEVISGQVSADAFFAPTVLIDREPGRARLSNQIEAFGPVTTLMPYKELADGLQILAWGGGSLVASVVTGSADVAARVAAQAASCHGRLLVLDQQAAVESTGHGAPLPALKHGGPGRAGGGEELGGMRAVRHYMQRTAIQGSPAMISAITGEYVRGAPVNESDQHPFRKHFEELAIGDSLLTHRRTVSEADLVNFGCLSGDFFYMHFDEIAARESQFGQRIAHGYFVLSAAAGLFVSPAPGPVLANYGLDTLRFVKPVGIGDTIRARLTCKRKAPRAARPGEQRQGVVVWDVQVTNQDDAIVASYDILTLVLFKPEASSSNAADRQIDA